MVRTCDHKEFWREFLELYRSLPALWKVKSVDYKDRHLKAECYKKLVKKLKEIDPKATRKTVTKKINAFRTNYRREERKVLESENSGGGGEIHGPYTPSLWYYNDFAFLRDQEEEQQQDDNDTVKLGIKEEDYKHECALDDSVSTNYSYIFTYK